MTQVEFIGLPGCGKSTLMASLAKLRRHYLTKDRAVYLGWRQHLRAKGRAINPAGLPYFLAHKVGVERWLCFLKSKVLCEDSIVESDGLLENVYQTVSLLRTSISDRYWLLDRVRENLADDILIHLSGVSGCVLLDEHFCQTALSLYAIRRSEHNSDHLVGYMSSMPLPQKVVFVKAPVELCFERLKTRDRGVQRIWRGLSDSALLDALKRTEETALKILTHLSSRGAEVISIENDMDFLTVVSLLDKKIRSS